MADVFPQALPGEATLSLYSRPCFLQWGADVASTVFGEELAAGFKRQAERVDLQWSGIVARPLYACTGGGTQCGGVAAMSPLLAFPRERQEWRCAACRRECAPVSDSAARSQPFPFDSALPAPFECASGKSMMRMWICE